MKTMLLDLQVNGFIGVDFSAPDSMPEGFREAGHALEMDDESVALAKLG